MTVRTRLAILILMMVFPYLQPVQAQARLNVEITGLKDSVAEICIQRLDSFEVVAAPVKNGKFTWVGSLSEPQEIEIVLSPSKRLFFFMENSNVSIKGNIDTLEMVEINGSVSQNEFNNYQKSIRDIVKREEDLCDEFRKIKDDGPLKDSVMKLFRPLRKERDRRSINYIHSNPNSPVSISLVSDMLRFSDRAYSEADSIYHLLSSSALQTVIGRRITNRLAILKKGSVGQQIIDFAQPDTAGKIVRMSDLRGKYVLLDFWASWCAPCRAEIPYLSKAYDKYKGRNFEILSISLDNNESKWKKAIMNGKMAWIQVSDLKGFDNEVGKLYGINSIPTTFLLDPNGVIIARNLRGEQVDIKLATLFK